MKVALSTALKPTAACDLKVRSKLCLGRLFLKKKTFKAEDRHFKWCFVRSPKVQIF